MQRNASEPCNQWNIRGLCIMGSSANSFKKLKGCLGYRQSLLFSSQSPQSGYSQASHMDQKCLKFPAVLFSNYCHQCLPLNWPGLSQHALLVLVIHNCRLQLPSKWGRDSATQLRGNCLSHAPLASVSPVDEEKCIHYCDVAATNI